MLLIVVGVLLSNATCARSARLAADAAPVGPMASVKSVVDQAIAVFKDQGIAPADREKKLRAIAESHFDFEKMARTAVGLPLARFLAVAARRVRAALHQLYRRRLSLADGAVLGGEGAADGSDRRASSSSGSASTRPIRRSCSAQVTLQDRAKPIDVNYLMKLDGSEWKIYDITLDAISVIANYRNQFNRVLNDGGYDKLVGIMRQKQQALGASMAKSNP